MSELQVEDWKLEAQAVVQLCRKKCDKSVSLSVLSITNSKKKLISLKLTVMATFTQNCICHFAGLLTKHVNAVTSKIIFKFKCMDFG